MHRSAIALVTLLPAAALVLAGSRPSSGAASIERLGWLAGCWERRSGDRVLEEQWMTPRGGTMLGMSRLVRGAETLSHESIRVYERDGTLVYAAAPAGQAPAEFTSVSLADDMAAFENPEHDFPQRIVYRHVAGDSLHARIEGNRGGETTGIDFRLGRVACGA